MAAFVLVSWLGFATQHLFLLGFSAALALYPTIPREERCGWRRQAIAAAAGLAGFAPLVLASAGFLRASAIRKSAAGFFSTRPAVLPRELATTFIRLLPGGLFPEVSANLLHRPRMLAAVLVGAAFQGWALLHALLSPRLGKAQRCWIVGILAITVIAGVPLSPGARPYSILWIPLALSFAVLFDRFRLLGPACLLLVAFSLVPYYSLGSFPYHRSNWRAAVDLVETGRITDSMGEVLVISGQSAGLAWDFYSASPGNRLAFGADEYPYTVRSERTVRGNPAQEAVDSLLHTGADLWIVLDVWGGRCPIEIPEDARTVLDTMVSEQMRVIHVDPSNLRSSPP